MEAVSCIKEALTVRTESDMSLKASKRENLLNTLIILLSKAKEERIRRPSLDTVDSMEATYMRGDLGFVPKVVELRSIVPTTRQMESQTGESFEEYLLHGTVPGVKLMYSESNENSSEDLQVEEEIIEESLHEPSVLFFDETEIPEEESLHSEFDIFMTEDDEVSGMDVTPKVSQGTEKKEAPTPEKEKAPPKDDEHVQDKVSGDEIVQIITAEDEPKEEEKD